VSSLPYIPAEYVTTQSNGVFFHFSPHEAESDQYFVIQACQTALHAVRRILDCQPQRCVHVCCFYSTDDAQQAMKRRLSPTMALAPYSTSESGLIIVHSPGIDPLNADVDRMRRLFAHEVVHLLVAETTGSTKVLGDGNANMHVSAWLNEGLAEVVSFRSIDADVRLGAIIRGYLHAKTYYPFGVLSQWLDDLNSDSRSLAFAHVLAAVELLCQRYGIHAVFDHIQRIEAFFDPSDVCSPSRLADLATILN